MARWWECRGGGEGVKPDERRRLGWYGYYATPAAREMLLLQHQKRGGTLGLCEKLRGDDGEESQEKEWINPQASNGVGSGGGPFGGLVMMLCSRSNVLTHVPYNFARAYGVSQTRR